MNEETKKRKLWNVQGGALLSTVMALATIAATFGGVREMVRYLEARNAVEEAVRRSVRCLIPTSGECSQDRPGNTTSGELFEWSSVRSREVKSVVVPVRQHQASYMEETWQTTLSTLAEAGVREFYVPQFDRFPEWDLEAERRMDRSATWEQSPPLARGERGLPLLTSLPLGRGDLIVPENQTVVLESDCVMVPTLEGNPNSSSLARYPDGRSFPAGTVNGGVVNWITNAQLIIRVTGRFRPTRQSVSTARIRWGGEDVVSRAPGFEFQTCSERGVKQGDWAARGGRDFSDALGPDAKSYSLWARGADGSHGGYGDTYPRILIPRGRGVSIRTRLRATGGDVTASALTADIFYDAYDRREGERLVRVLKLVQLQRVDRSPPLLEQFEFSERHEKSLWDPKLSPPERITEKSHFITAPPFDAPSVDLSAEANGTCLQNYDDLDQLRKLLRPYAARYVPSLRDERIALTVSAPIVGNQLAAQSGGCTGEAFGSLPRCSGGRTEVSSVQECTPQPLGTFPVGVAPSGCESNANACRSVPLSIKQGHQPESMINIQKAKALGVEELKRVFPDLRLNCDQIGCGDISIQVLPTGTIRADAVVHLPRVFPFDSLNGSSVAVRAAADDLTERGMIQRGKSD